MWIHCLSHMQECRDEPEINNYGWIYFSIINSLMNYWGVRLTLLECKLESEKVNKNIGTNKAGSDVKKVQYMKLYLASQCI